MQVGLLAETVKIFGLTIAVLYICNRFRIPTVVGFLISGMIAGPSALGLVGVTHEVELLAEIGVVLLLFTIGIEFSLGNLFLIRRYVLLGGSLQVMITLGLTALFCYLTGLGWGEAIFIGFLISLSSTAIVLKILQVRDEIASPHGRTILAILIFQDIIAVPMMLMLPMLSGENEGLGRTFGILLLKGAGIIAITLLGAKYVMPKLLFHIAKLRSQEIFLISIIVICFAVAWLTSSMGLSLALGAFLAGLIISESEYSHQALSNIMPFRDIFTSFFFISIGMLLDVQLFVEKPLLVLAITAGVMLLKFITGGIAAFGLGFPVRTVMLTAVGLAQIGEFSFILSKEGMKFNLLSEEQYQVFLAVSILSMVTSPFLLPVTSKLTTATDKWPLPRFLRLGIGKPGGNSQEINLKVNMKDHIIIVGYGVTGRNVAKAAKAANIPYVIIEMNPQTVKKERAAGEPVYYGDAVQGGILEHVSVDKARVLVTAVPDVIATRGIVAQAHRQNPRLYIIARTRYMTEMVPLLKVGANEVVPEEFETSIEIFSIVLTKYLVGRDEIDQFIHTIRADKYKMMRSKIIPSLSLSDVLDKLGGADINIFAVPEKSPLANRTLREVNLRREYNVTLLAVLRGEETLVNPVADSTIHPMDRMIVFGRPDSLAVFHAMLNADQETS